MIRDTIHPKSLIEILYLSMATLLGRVFPSSRHFGGLESYRPDVGGAGGVVVVLMHTQIHLSFSDEEGNPLCVLVLCVVWWRYLSPDV